jgi:hypothetical protein
VHDAAERANTVSLPRYGQEKSLIGNRNPLLKILGPNMLLFLPIRYHHPEMQLSGREKGKYYREMGELQLLCWKVTPEPTMKH